MREIRLSGSVEGVKGNHDSYSDTDSCGALGRLRQYGLARAVEIGG
jgi:hypothetical protein